MGDFLPATVGERLDQIRKREGLSQGDFCELLGISRSSLKNYVSGERDVPVSVLATLLEKFSIDPVWMMLGDESDAAMKRKVETLSQIRSIGLAVENRAHALDIELSAEERWRLVSQIYTAAIMQSGAIDAQRATSDFFLDNMFANNGFA